MPTPFIDFWDRNTKYSEDGDDFCGFNFHIGWLRQEKTFSISITIGDWAFIAGIDFSCN